MGYSNWSSNAYDHLSKSRASAPRAHVFRGTTVHKDMSPLNLTVRESRDSDIHPESVAVAVWLDITGSMGRIPENMAKGKLKELMDVMIAHGIAHPQVLFGAIGDLTCDASPLQVGQFESGNDELDKWLTSVHIEGHGGGQCFESYPLAWLVCARHTSCDCWEKRQQKAFCFTIGDEAPWATLSGSDGLQVKGLGGLMGYKQPSDESASALLEELERSYHVFHIHVQEGSYPNSSAVLDPWRELLGERLLILEDQNAVAETIATAVATTRGADLATVVKTLSPAVGESVSTALAPYVHLLAIQKSGTAAGIVTL